MLLPGVPTSGVVPSAITVEFTDYPSFMHHQTRQEQYRIACEEQQKQKQKQKQLGFLPARTSRDAGDGHDKNYCSEEEQYPAPLPQQLTRQQRPALGVEQSPGSYYSYADDSSDRTDFLYSHNGKSDLSPQTAGYALTDATADYRRRYEDAQGGGLFSTTYASGDGRSGPPNGLASRTAATNPGRSEPGRAQDQTQEPGQEEKEREEQRQQRQQQQQQQQQEQLQLLELGQLYDQIRQRPPHAILSARTSRTAANASLLAPGPTAAATDAAAVGSPAGSPACSSSASPPFCSPPSSSFSRRRPSQGHYHHHNILYSCHHGHQTHHPPSSHLQPATQRRRPKTHAYSQRPASPAASAAPVLSTAPALFPQKNGHIAAHDPVPSHSAASAPFYLPFHHALAGAMDDNRPDGGDVAGGGGDAYSLTPADDIAAQELAARDYRPDLTGPCINEIRPTEEIARYYAGGDAVLAHKAANLPADYPFYRAVRGDGNCGWRAIGFCYFESLVNAGDTDQIRRERARLAELNAFIRDVGGYDPYVYEDMVEETDILFGAILDAIPDTAKAVTAVTDAFNDDSAGNAIIYHLRLLSASFLKDNVAQYEGFLAHEGGAAGYCLEFIERPNCEIDHLRMELLTRILLMPTDMFLEIAYLDRSPTHDNAAFVYVLPNENVGRDEQTINMRISLLFRPDHYDILYRRANQAHGAANDATQNLLPVGASSTPGQDAAGFQHGADPQPFASHTNNADLPNAPAMQTNQAMASFSSGPDDAAAAAAGQYAAGFGYFEALGNMLSSTVVPAPSVDQGVSDLGPSLPAASPASAVTTPTLSVTSQGTIASRTDIATPPIHPPMMASQQPLPVGACTKLPHASLDTIPRTPTPLASDIQVHRVSTAPFANATQSVARLDTFATADLSVLGFLPTMFGSYMPQQSASIFPSGPLGGSLGGPLGGGPLDGSFGLQQTGFGDVFAPSPMAHCPPSQLGGMSPVPSVSAASPASSTGMVDKATAVRPGEASAAVDEPASRSQAADVGAFGEPFAECGSYHAAESARQDVPMSRTPTPSTPGMPAQAMQAEVTSRPATPQGLVSTGVGPFVPGPPEANPVRFTKWHFERRPEQEPPEGSQQSAVPPRSNQRLNLAHFSNPSFRPEEYRPAEDDTESTRGHPGARSRRRSRRESGAKRADKERGT